MKKTEHESDGRVLYVCLILCITLLTIAITVIGGILLAFKTLDLQACTIQGNSMLPTIENGTSLLLNPKKEIERFDIVVFEHDGRHVLKRVIGLPGDDIVVLDGKLFINKQLYPETYLDRERCQLFEGKDFKIHIPEDHYFMMGDNRDESVDSRDDGPIPKSQVIGVAILELDQ